MSDALVNELHYDDVFYSTNLNCPIDDVALTQGTQYFVLEETADQYQYMFKVSLRD